jgi:hypothetical protein
MITRRLPLSVDPLPGESLISYLSAVAMRFGISLGSLADSFGYGRLTRWQITRILTVRPSPTNPTLDVLDAVANATGRRSQDLIQMIPASGRRWPFAAATLHQFCPECIASNNGRRQRTWSEGVTATCEVHGVILETRCRGCGATQFPAPMAPNSTSPNRCRICRRPHGGTGHRAPADSAIHRLSPSALGSLKMGDLNLLVDLVQHLAPGRIAKAMEPTPTSSTFDVALTHAAHLTRTESLLRYPDLRLHAYQVTIGNVLELIRPSRGTADVQTFEYCYPGELERFAAQVLAHRHANLPRTVEFARDI